MLYTRIDVSSGRYQPTSFFGIVEFIKDLEQKDKFRDFISVRRRFEDFLMKYKKLPMQIVYRYGSGLKGYQPMKELFKTLLECFVADRKDDEILKILVADPQFSFLQPQEITGPDEAGKHFNTDTKSAAFLRDALKEPLRCAICGGLIHFNSISVDHIKRKADGGLGAVDNAQLTHPYCNTTIKN